jgi:hypothetical protein
MFRCSSTTATSGSRVSAACNDNVTEHDFVVAAPSQRDEAAKEEHVRSGGVETGVKSTGQEDRACGCEIVEGEFLGRSAAEERMSRGRYAGRTRGRRQRRMWRSRLGVAIGVPLARVPIRLRSVDEQILRALLDPRLLRIFR